MSLTWSVSGRAVARRIESLSLTGLWTPARGLQQYTDVVECWSNRCKYAARCKSVTGEIVEHTLSARGTNPDDVRTLD